MQVVCSWVKLSAYCIQFVNNELEFKTNPSSVPLHRNRFGAASFFVRRGGGRRSSKVLCPSSEFCYPIQESKEEEKRKDADVSYQHWIFVIKSPDI
jgi:hypothetical protein